MLPRRREPVLLRLLVTYQTIWDFLDCASERAPGARNAYQLHLALTEALDPSSGISDYYRHHPWRRDEGYLHALVHACREGCAALPAYPRVRAQILDGTALCSLQSINHDTDSNRRDAALEAWAHERPRAACELEWFEWAAAASAFTPHVLLALAAQPGPREGDLASALDAYFPWFSLAITMLDSYVDRREDRARGHHSYISHYGHPDDAARRLAEIVARCIHQARALPDGHRHATVVASMVAMHLSRPAAWAPATRPHTLAIAAAGGNLTRTLLPLARMWRAVHLRSGVSQGR